LQWADKIKMTQFIMHMLECFDMCYELTAEEISVYEEPGYMFPALRPFGELFLLPSDEQSVPIVHQPLNTDRAHVAIDQTVDDAVAIGTTCTVPPSAAATTAATTMMDRTLASPLRLDENDWESSTQLLDRTLELTEEHSEPEQQPLRFMGKRVTQRGLDPKLPNELFFRLQVCCTDASPL
jgi:hypothetical protein